MAPDTRELLDRIRRLMPRVPIREANMFGVVALMLDDAIVIAVGKDGTLLVRVSTEEDAALLESSDAARAEMGTGRSMGVGWLRVTLDDDPSRLRFWVEAALRRRSGTAR